MEIKVCVIQFDIQWLSPEKNISIVRAKLESIEKDVDLVVLPEMFLTGFCMDPSLSAIKENSDEVKELIEIAKINTVAIIGSLAIKEDEKYYNRVFLLTEDGISGRYDKQYLFSPSGENEVFDSKHNSNLIQFKGWNILPQVCYDLRFPENVRHLPAPDLLIYMANWPSPRINHWDTLLKARAIENLCFTVGCNRLGIDGNSWEYPGHSVIIKPDGSVFESEDNTNAITITLSLSELQKYRLKYRFLGDKK